MEATARASVRREDCRVERAQSRQTHSRCTVHPPLLHSLTRLSVCLLPFSSCRAAMSVPSSSPCVSVWQCSARARVPQRQPTRRPQWATGSDPPTSRGVRAATHGTPNERNGSGSHAHARGHVARSTWRGREGGACLIATLMSLFLSRVCVTRSLTVASCLVAASWWWRRSCARPPPGRTARAPPSFAVSLGARSLSCTLARSRCRFLRRSRR